MSNDAHQRKHGQSEQPEKNQELVVREWELEWPSHDEQDPSYRCNSDEDFPYAPRPMG